MSTSKIGTFREWLRKEDDKELNEAKVSVIKGFKIIVKSNRAESDFVGNRLHRYFEKHIIEQFHNTNLDYSKLYIESEVGKGDYAKSFKLIIAIKSDISLEAISYLAEGKYRALESAINLFLLEEFDWSMKQGNISFTISPVKYNLELIGLDIKEYNDIYNKIFKKLPYVGDEITSGQKTAKVIQIINNGEYNVEIYTKGYENTVLGTFKHNVGFIKNK